MAISTAPAGAPAPSGRKHNTSRKIAETVLWHVTLLLACAFVLFPIVMVFFGSFKSTSEFFKHPYDPPISWALMNYRQAWNEANLQNALKNSIISTAFGVGVSTFLAALASYGLSRFRFAGRLSIRLIFIGGLVVPIQLIILPLFIIYRDLHVLGGLWPLCLTFAVFGIPLAVLVLTGFFALLPRDLEDAARIDGASHLQIFWRIMLPLSRPALAAVVILNGVWMWNDFFLGFILISDADSYTLPVAVMAFRGTYLTKWGLIFASVIISAIPVITAYLLLSKQFITGLTAGSVKG
jgi:raffinose/stachyose/melibiose transport system permease protein